MISPKHPIYILDFCQTLVVRWPEITIKGNRMEKKKISPRIEGQSQEFLSKNFNTLNAGAEYVLDGFPMLYNRTLHEMKGRFTNGELSFLVEAFKETKLSPQLAGQQLRIYCDDAMMFRKLHEKWKIKSDVFLKKIKISSGCSEPRLILTFLTTWLKRCASAKPVRLTCLTPRGSFRPSDAPAVR